MSNKGGTKLGIGVKELAGGGGIVVQTLKKTKNEVSGKEDLGPAERAGLRLNDILLGVNYHAFPGGLHRAVDFLKDAQNRDVLHLQVTRDMAKSPERPTCRTFPFITELVSQCRALYRARVLDETERSTLLDMILKIMAVQVDEEDRGLHVDEEESAQTGPVPMESVHTTVERLVVRAKRLREAVCTRCLDWKRVSDTVYYILRVEDVESGRWWLVEKRYRDFYVMHQQLVSC